MAVSSGASARTDSRSAASATDRVIGPAWSSEAASGTTPSSGTRPKSPFSPTTPQYAAGRRIEPTVCVPIAPGTCRAATAAPDPDDDPPGVRSAAHGFVVGAGSLYANCVATVLPTITAPAARSRATSVASRVGWRWANAGAPAVVVIPAT